MKRLLAIVAVTLCPAAIIGILTTIITEDSNLAVRVVGFTYLTLLLLMGLGWGVKVLRKRR